MKLNIQFFALLVFILAPQVHAQKASQNSKSGGYEVAVYYFPNYHPDSINTRWHGKGWTEWEVVKAAKPRFAGHEQPKVPNGDTLMKQILNGHPKKLILPPTMVLIVSFMIGTGIQIPDNIFRKGWKKDS